MQPAVFLDRDNTLIQNEGDLGNPEEVRLVEGVPAGLKVLREAGYHLVVVTNQAGVARGRFTEEDVDAVHQRIAVLADTQAHSIGLIDRFYYCPYHPEATVAEYRRDHPWRKPHPGMILQAARDMGVELAQSWMIGDQERDIRAGQAAGCRTILITRDAELAQRVAPTEVVTSFGDAVQFIRKHSKNFGGAPAPRAGSNTAVPRLSEPEAIEGPSAISSQLPAENREPIAATRTPGSESRDSVAAVQRSLTQLTEELRSDRIRRGEFTLLRMLAGLAQLLALLLAMLGLLQLDEFQAFVQWMVGAAMVQLVTITLLILDLKA